MAATPRAALSAALASPLGTLLPDNSTCSTASPRNGACAVANPVASTCSSDGCELDQVISVAGRLDPSDRN